MNTLLPVDVSAKDYFVNHPCGFHKFKSSVVIVVILLLVYEINFFNSYFVRYITILYFLNDVEEGGQTAFPVADNETFNHEVCLSDRSYIHTNKFLS